MNYLAHLYLSGNQEQVMVGNFIADHVKGKAFERFPPHIKRGIVLHRQIDSFTDAHTKFREAKTLFRHGFGLYSGIVIDFLYDHFLAGNWDEYSDVTLRTFAKQSHAVLLKNFMHLPRRVQGFLPFLIQHRRLESYASPEGIIAAMEIMGKHTSFPAQTDFVRETLHTNYGFLKSNFEEFMRDMIDFVEGKNAI